MLKPPQLCPGDTVATVTLSWGGPGTYPQRYQAGVYQLQETFGLRVVASRHALRPDDWLARHPQARAEDLMECFADPSIRGIISTIGGDDSIRLLPHLDLAVIRANPKVFLGYSDTTVSHLACHKAGLISFYGPAIMSGFAENGGMFDYTIDSLRRTLFSATPPGQIAPNRAGWTVELLDWGQPELQHQRRTLQPSTVWRWLQGQGLVAGPLLGGCVEVLDRLRGTELWPAPAAWDGAILFLETSEEAPPPELLTHFLRTLAVMGLLERIAAILFARPGGQIPPTRHADYDAALLAAVRDEAGLAIPLVTGMDFGHTDPMMVLPIGGRAQLDCTTRTFAIVEAAVGPRQEAA